MTTTPGPAAGSPDWPASTRWTSTCAKCGQAPPGPGGILCPPCKAAIEEQNRRVAAGQPLATPESEEEKG